MRSRSPARPRSQALVRGCHQSFLEATIVAHLILALSFSSAIRADDEGVSVPWRLANLERGYAMAQASYLLDLEKLKGTPEEGQRTLDAWKQFQEKITRLFSGALELAESNVNPDDRFAALAWILNHWEAYDLPVGLTALHKMTGEYPDHPDIGPVIANLSYNLPYESEPAHRPALDLIKAVAERNPDRTARGQALVGLANIAREKFEFAESRRNPEVNPLLHEARKAYELVLREYGDCLYLRTSGGGSPRRTLGEEAKVALFELDGLRIGQVAPEIEGEDLDGVKFRLSDSRGKVVLLVFWASWCGPCMTDVPHEKELVARFEGRPFVLIGVNGDSIKAQAVEAVEKLGIPWRSFWNEGQSSGVPIRVTWNVRRWPTVYVLDHEGVIRHKYLRGDALDEPLEKLVSAAETEQKQTE